MFSNITPYYRDIGNGLVMKSVSSMEDVLRIMDLLKIVFPEEESVARFFKTLILNHPYVKPDYFLFIEDEVKKKVVSTICLLPFIWKFDEIELKVGEMGIVGTLEEYRNKGLIRELNERHKELLLQDQYDMAIIEGIAYFYKQFGYEYAIPLEPWYQLDLQLIPDKLSEKQQEYRFLKANREDIPLLSEFYQEMNIEIEINSPRDEKLWQYLLGPSSEYDPTMEIWLILDKNDENCGYFRVTQEGFGEGLIVRETSIMSFDISHSVLYKLKDLCIQYDKPYLRFNMHKDSTLLKVAQSLGAIDKGHYAWQIKVVDWSKFLKKIKPVLEKRIENSLFSDLSEDFYIDMYRNALELKIDQGEILQIKMVPSMGEAAHIRIPPNLMVPFIFGYHNRKDLEQFNHDFSYNKKWELFIDILFPKMKSFIYTIY